MHDIFMVLSFSSMIGGFVIHNLTMPKSKCFSLMLFIFVIITVLANMAWYCCDWFTGDGVTWAVIYTITSTLTGTGIRDFIFPGIKVLSFCVFLFFVGYILIFNHRVTKKINSNYAILSVVLFLLSFLLSPLSIQGIMYFVQNQNGDEKEFSKYYISQTKLINHPKYNLVYIYGESLEHAFFDGDIFPGLANDIQQLDVHVLDFNNTTQYPGMDFTIGGIVASQCGLPLYSSVTFGKTEVKDGFFSGSICLGDILKQSGYENYFFQGADLRFTDKISFFNKHGFEHVYGLMESGLQNNFKAQNSWGLYDDITLSMAWNKFQELSQRGKRFSLFTLTLDTHPPKGFISPECSKTNYVIDGKSIDSLNAVQCSQSMIASFIRKIINSPWAENTIVVLSSDHLATANISQIYGVLQEHKRSNTFMVLTKGYGLEVNNSLRSSLDNGATILEIMGGGGSIGLGRSSISLPSLSTVFSKFDDKILKWIPAIKSRWSIYIKDNSLRIDVAHRQVDIGGSNYQLPVLIYKDKNGYTPITDNYGNSPLRFSLYKAKIGTMFYWIDHCSTHGNIWDEKLSLSQGWCAAEGMLGGKITVSRLSQSNQPSEINISTSLLNKNHYEHDVRLLSMASQKIQYDSDEIFFNFDGLPRDVSTITGLGKIEDWGRWSDANLYSTVTIKYKRLLPKNFQLILKAKAWDKNIGLPVAIRVGNQTKYVKLKSESETYCIDFNMVESYTIELVPPLPQESWTGSTVGSPAIDGTLSKIGIGLESLKVKDNKS